MSSSSEGHALVLSGVRHTWPDGAVALGQQDALDLVVPTGRSGLVGVNGSGKSTLLRIAAGVLTPTAGAVRVTGEVGYLPQDLTLDRRRCGSTTCWASVPCSASLRRLDTGAGDAADLETVGDDWDLEERVVVELERVGLAASVLDRALGELSGGEVVRLGLADAAPAPARRAAARRADQQPRPRRPGPGCTTSSARGRGRSSSSATTASCSSGWTASATSDRAGCAGTAAGSRRTTSRSAPSRMPPSRPSSRPARTSGASEPTGSRPSAWSPSARSRDSATPSGPTWGRRRATSYKNRSEELGGVPPGPRRAPRVGTRAAGRGRVAAARRPGHPRRPPDAAAPRGRSVLTTDGLVLRTGTAVALDLRGPERVAVVGPNGSGKTTLLETIAGLVPPLVGSVDVRVAVRAAAAAARRPRRGPAASPTTCRTGGRARPVPVPGQCGPTARCDALRRRASEPPWPRCCSPTRRLSCPCSTSRPTTSTSRRTTRWSPRSRTTVVHCSWSPRRPLPRGHRRRPAARPRRLSHTHRRAPQDRAAGDQAWRVDEAPRLFEILSDPETVRWFGTPTPLTEVSQAAERIRGSTGTTSPAASGP